MEQTPLPEDPSEKSQNTTELRADAAVKLALDTQVELVIHTREARRAQPAGLLALELLSRCNLNLYGARDAELDLRHLGKAGRKVLVLFPSEEATPLTHELVRGSPPITLVVPDGTWRQARRAAQRIPGLASAERVRLPDTISDTFNALTQALAILESEEVAVHLQKALRERQPPPPLSVADAAPRHVESNLLEILYQDEFLIAVNKPSGLLVHRGWGKDQIPALQLLRDQIGRRVHAVHRLDRATSGVLLFAFQPEVVRDLKHAFEEGQVKKRYLAIVRGNRLEHDRLDHPLAKTENGTKLPATTNFGLLGTFERYGLVEALPETGRTHQIRRHLKHLSLPIIGDVRYGKGEHNRIFRERFGFHRLALHCDSLSLIHPRRGNRIDIHAPLPKDFQELIDRFVPWESKTRLSPGSAAPKASSLARTWVLAQNPDEGIE